jgi:YD repeat-containing protein
LDEVDVTLPVTRDAGIPLVRHFDSFRKPSPDTLGASWSWELPRLRKISRTIRRDEKGAHCVDGCELDWPGQGAPTLFRKAVFDPETRSQLMLPEGGQSAAITGLTSMQDARLGQRTDAVLFRDGRSWHFDVQGMLVAQYAPPRRMILRRGLDGTIRKVEGWNGDRRTSEAALGYDAEGKLTNIRTSDGQEVRYAYDDARRLVDVSGPQRRRRYQYDERGLVRSIEADGRQVTSFEYDDRGRVTRVVRPDGETVDYRAKPDGDRLAVTATGPGGTEVVHYGPDMRVLDRVTTDGTRVEWSGTAAEPRVRVHASDGENRTYTREPRPGGCAWRQEDAIQRVTSYDNNGRLVAIERDGQEVARFSWRPDGQLAAAVCEGASWAPQYRADGVQVGMRLAPAALPSTWFETTYDDAGRVVGSLDSEGVRTLVTRETNGWVRAYQAGTSGGDAVRLDVTRDPRGRLARVEDADGGWRSVSYTEGDRVPNRIEWSRQGASACLDFDRGFPWRLRWFDGAVWKAELDRAPGTNALIGLMKGPAGLRVEYGYDAQRRLARVISGPVYAMDIEYDPAGRVARVTQRPGSPSRRWWRRP